MKIIGIGALAVAIIVAAAIFSSVSPNPGAPNVRFAEFTPDRLEIKVGESTKIIFNVQNMESRAINDSRVDIVIQPSSYQPFLSISDSSVELSSLDGKDSRSGQKEVVITATGNPAKEAVYTVKGILIVEGEQSDVKEFDLKIVG